MIETTDWKITDKVSRHMSRKSNRAAAWEKISQIVSIDQLVITIDSIQYAHIRTRTRT